MDPKEAIALFNSSRGHAIERQNYLEDLQRGPKRSNEGMEKSEQEPQRGQSVHRPCFSPLDSDPPEEGRAPGPDCWDHRIFPQRGANRPSSRPLLPLPPCRPSMQPPFLPYRWTPPYPDTQHWRHFPPQHSRPRNPPPEPEWRSYPQQTRTRGPYPHAPHHSVLPRYSPSTCMTNESNGCSPPEEQTPRNKTHHRHAHQQRVKKYRNKY
ncbi:hypothetical protein LDENG_00153700 [Lucifuga dentata]|nr:hypothetical protein LDENG_00153700 [Lucifuga dentata]